MAMRVGLSLFLNYFIPRVRQSLAHSAYSKKVAEQITGIQEKAEVELSFEDR